MCVLLYFCEPLGGVCEGAYVVIMTVRILFTT